MTAVRAMSTGMRAEMVAAAAPAPAAVVEVVEVKVVVAAAAVAAAWAGGRGALTARAMEPSWSPMVGRCVAPRLTPG
jgi:hypothetical protein